MKRKYNFILLLLISIIFHGKAQNIYLPGIYKSDSVDLVYNNHGGFYISVSTILLLNFDSIYYEIKYSNDSSPPQTTQGKWKLESDTLILTGDDTIKHCDFDVTCTKHDQNIGLKILLRTKNGMPIQGKIKLNSTKFRKSNIHGEIYYSKSEFDKILTSLSKTTYKNFSSLDYEFKKYKGGMTSNFDENCNALQLIFDIDPNNMPAKFIIQKWKIKECTLSFINSDNNLFYQDRILPRHSLSKENCK